MPHYRVTAVMRSYLETTIEAPDLETAKEMARNGDIDGGQFTEQEGGTDWETFWDEVEEVKDERHN